MKLCELKILTFALVVSSLLCVTSADADIVYGDSATISFNALHVDPVYGDTTEFGIDLNYVARAWGDSGELSIDIPGMPRVLDVTSSTPDGLYSLGDTISLLIEFSETVYVDTTGGLPYVELEAGGVARQVYYESGSGTDTLIFSPYTVQPGDWAQDLDYGNEEALSANGALIRNSEGFDVDLALPPPGLKGSLGYNRNLTILAEFFDGFAYPTASDPQFSCFGWYLRDGSGGPSGKCGETPTLWDSGMVSFGDGTVRLGARTDGYHYEEEQCPGTRQSELGMADRFFEGTYAARIRFTDDPAQHNQASVQAFFTITPNSPAMECDPDYSEIDWEYFVIDGRDPVCPGPALYTGAVELYNDSDTTEPDCTTENSFGRQCGSLDGWHVLTLQVSDGAMSFYPDTGYLGTIINNTYPELPMRIVFQHWFDVGLSPGLSHDYEMQVDWVYHARNVVLTPDQVNIRVLEHALAGHERWDTMGDRVDANLNGIPDECDVTGDLNGDGMLTVDDWVPFCLCMCGSRGAVDLPCELADFDRDADVDLADFAEFARALAPAPPPVPTPPPGMVLIPGGGFQMGDPWEEGNSNELPVHAVDVSPFFIDTHEVTNQQYVQALNWAVAQGGLITVTNGVVYRADTGTSQPLCSTASAPAGSPYYGNYSVISWDGSEFTALPDEQNHPVAIVSWYGAAAFCNWRSGMDGKEPCFDPSTWVCDFSRNGYRLPTEAEWEKAAGWDPVLEQHYRFGEGTDGCGLNCLDGQRANYSGNGDPFDNATTPAGYFNGTLYGSFQTQDATSAYGCYDMSGNVWEWCCDWYSSTYYASSPSVDPTGPASGSQRVMRGGAWNNIGVLLLRSAQRSSSAPSSLYTSVGFRCAAGAP
ncbi:MAG: SUMF1/EgtB/PvdO family nonheme iron enzyme [Phycisphaerae bacterium]|nr:SUMF1/EgtB/PvdO family nonheme iron enzyme [Phycisphaerae bacterium]